MTLTYLNNHTSELKGSPRKAPTPPPPSKKRRHRRVTDLHPVNRGKGQGKSRAAATLQPRPAPSRGPWDAPSAPPASVRPAAGFPRSSFPKDGRLLPPDCREQDRPSRPSRRVAPDIQRHRAPDAVTGLLLSPAAVTARGPDMISRPDGRK